MRLKGRRIIITGAGSGIGLATARLFSAEGAKLGLLDLNIDAAHDLAASPGNFATELNVSDEQAVHSAVEQAAQAMGGIDGVVNAAGIISLGPLASTELDSWQRQIDVNMTGPFLLCRAALPWLQQFQGSTIVNIASAQALSPAGASCGYAASKAGLLNFTKAIALELAPDIRANAICPGMVDTPMVSGVNQSANKPDATPTLGNYPLGRMAQPEEIAQAILYLTSEESSYVTGTAHAVDGGRSMH